jgi:hypothetical protein
MKMVRFPEKHAIIKPLETQLQSTDGLVAD